MLAWAAAKSPTALRAWLRAEVERRRAVAAEELRDVAAVALPPLPDLAGPRLSRVGQERGSPMAVPLHDARETTTMVSGSSRKGRGEDKRGRGQCAS